MGNDKVHCPDHYTWRGTECIKIADALCRCAQGIKAYLIGCVVKYIYRYPMKNGYEDIDKAIECLKILRKVEYPDAPERPEDRAYRMVREMAA